MRITRESIDRFVANGRRSNRENLGLDYQRRDRIARPAISG